VSERGPEHSKTFTVEVRVGKEWSGQAEGRTKKIAAQRAARESTSGCSGRSTKQQNRRSLIDVAQVFFPISTEADHGNIAEDRTILFAAMLIPKLQGAQDALEVDEPRIEPARCRFR